MAEKIYVVHRTWRTETEDGGDMSAWSRLESAKAEMARLAEEEKQNYEGKDAIVEEGDFSFEIYTDGYYLTDSVSISISELPVGD